MRHLNLSGSSADFVRPEATQKPTLGSNAMLANVVIS
eukprot:CAMPEP_0169138924 /NCGR_PEP_ID=MMETSP1015-20121227/42632_1 /TAXON_ID=342587 /ORGANISM="Karlodinium micrum, Strain CCMP2283" /LENGTH=36 /DNA_ID= /DNA_START= /DNA_END= /DNA_ORIENTATION=